MAEIKSTLELVMERTRHMTQTEEDKREQALAEFRRSLGGLLQKVQDGLLSPERFEADLRALQENLPFSPVTVVLEELTSRLDLDGDNGWLLSLLTGALRMNTDELARLFGDYREVRELLVQTRTDELRNSLFESRGISGSAVIPNYAADPEWAADNELLRERFTVALKEAVARLKVSAAL